MLVEEKIEVFAGEYITCESTWYAGVAPPYGQVAPTDFDRAASAKVRTIF